MSLSCSSMVVIISFFFQAEDGIRGRTVTGVQTCALPIFPPGVVPRAVGAGALRGGAAPAHPVRAGVDDGGPARLTPPPGARLLRHHRPPGHRPAHHARRAVSALGHTLDPPQPGADARAAHGSGAGRTRSRSGAAARRGGRVNTARAPLSGVRVADFTWVWAGPFCTLQLAHLGAEVIRVETATRLCVTRLLPPYPRDMEPGPNRSGYFNQYNQGKKSITLDLKRPEAVAVAKRLCAASDVVVENFAAGVMERMGLGYDALRALRPDLVMISLSGYGATGPDRDKVSYGPAQVPLSGLSSVTGYRGWLPMHVGISYGDPTGGLHGAVAILAALLHRARTGEGQYIDLSQWESSMTVLPEAIVSWTMNGVAPPRDGNRDPHMAPHGIFRAAGDDRWIAIAIEDDAAWARFVRCLGRPELADDARFATLVARKRHEDDLEALVTEWTQG